MREHVAVDAVAIADHVAARRVPGEGLGDLSCRPFGGWIRGHVEVQGPPAVVRQDQEDVQDAQPDRGDGEEVDRREARHVVVGERAPALRRRLVVPDHVLRDGRLRDFDAELAKFAVDSGRSPRDVLGGHFPDEITSVLRNERPARAPALAPPGPVEPPAPAMPGDDGIGPDDPDRLLPSGPCPREPDPKDAVDRTQPWPRWRRAEHDVELVLQGDVLEHQVARPRERGPDVMDGIPDEADHGERAYR
jgi:hypothetical protein